MKVFDAVVNRRSVRKFEDKEVAKEDIRLLIEAAHWAPSGKNGQPWKFVIVQDDKKLIDDIANLSTHKLWLRNAPCLIIVYLDKYISYDCKKDLQAIGAAIQNLLLTAYDMGLGSCWVGELLGKDNFLNTMLNIDTDYELMAVIALGYPDSTKLNITKRKNVDECIAKWL